MKAPLPPKLYKYQSFNDYNLNNLRKKTFWFSKPESFNDPFDCNINFQVGDITKENLELLFTSFRKEAPNKKEFDRIYHSDGRVTKLFKDIAIESSRKATSELVKKFASLGITCFSEINDDILMWSHYATSHQGFCLEFDTTQFPFTRTHKPDRDSTLEKVVYSDSYPLVSLKDIALKKHLPSLSQDLLSAKSSHWSYEKEWRLFLKYGNAKLEYEKTALTGVYLGCKITAENEEIIRSILGNSVPIYKMQRSMTEFKVTAMEIK